MECRRGCGACCIAPSIVQPYYGMPAGKPAGVSCVHLDPNTMDCGLFGDPRRPAACGAFVAEEFLCGSNRQQALVNIALLEHESRPR